MPETRTLHVVIADDELLARQRIEDLLAHDPSVVIAGTASNGPEAVAAIRKFAPDLVFLDVQMPGLTGFEVARRMLDARKGPQIIFVTAYDQHAIKAFEINAVDYLLKPVEQARLELAVQRARRRIEVDRMDRAASAGTLDGTRWRGTPVSSATVTISAT